MSTDPRPDSGGSNPTFRGWFSEFDPFRHPRRIVLLDELETHTSVEIRTLGRRLLARERGCTPGEVSSTAVDEAHVSLVHNHLPRLAAHDLVTVDWESRIVTSGRDVPPQVSSLASLLEKYSKDERHRILDALSHPIRVSIVSILREENRTISLESLAALLANRVDVPCVDDEAMMVELHHWHLPVLKEIDLVTYDASSAKIVQLEEPYGTT